MDLEGAATLAGWPTPNTPSGGRSTTIEKMSATGMTTDGRKHTVSLEHVVKFAGWATPDAQAMNLGSDPQKHFERLDRLKAKHNNGNGAGLPLAMQANLAGWATPTTRDHKDTGDLSQSMVRKDGKSRNDCLARQSFGIAPTGSPASTASRAALNPAFSLWLMGYPVVEWLLAAPSSKPSPRYRTKKPRTSSVASASCAEEATPSTPSAAQSSSQPS